MKKTTGNEKYKTTLLQYFEEEIMGEAYFHGLTTTFDEPGQREKLILLAKVERHAAEAVRPLLEKHGLEPRPDADLGQRGQGWTEASGQSDWRAFIADMSIRYVGYVEDFEKLEQMAPNSDLPALKILTDHEVAAIEFANLELAGDRASTAPLRRYLASDSA